MQSNKDPVKQAESYLRGFDSCVHKLELNNWAVHV